MIKKILITIGLITVIGSLMVAPVYATDPTPTPSQTKDNPLVPKFVTPSNANMESSKFGVVQRLPGGEWTVILGEVIKIVLSITGSLALISFTVGGVMMVIAQGNEEQIGKGKGILLYSVLALIIIAASYAITVGITKLQIFQ